MRRRGPCLHEPALPSGIPGVLRVGRGHGGPLNNGLWSWHDLAELAATQRRTLDTAAHALRSYERGNDAKELAREVAFQCEELLNAARKERRQIADFCETAHKEQG